MLKLMIVSHYANTFAANFILYTQALEKACQERNRTRFQSIFKSTSFFARAVALP